MEKDPVEQRIGACIPVSFNDTNVVTVAIVGWVTVSDE